MKILFILPLIIGALAMLSGCNDSDNNASAPEATPSDDSSSLVQLGPRPYFLVNDMDEGELKSTLQACESMTPTASAFSIAHRGAPLQFPEHTRESYVAAAKMGAGIIECDVAFTKDRHLVCRHAQNDLHTTTNIVAVPELNAKCTQPFVPANPSAGTKAEAECRTSDITLAEFKTLRGKMDAFNGDATTPEEYLGGTADWRTNLYATEGTLLSHRESIQLIKELGLKFTPELKTPVVWSRNKVGNKTFP